MVFYLINLYKTNLFIVREFFFMRILNYTIVESEMASKYHSNLKSAQDRFPIRLLNRIFILKGITIYRNNMTIDCTLRCKT